MSQRKPTRPDSQPTAIATVAQSDGGRLGAISRQSLAIERLNNRLGRILPPDLAGHFQITSIRGETLIIAVETPAWASRLRYLTQQLLDLTARVTETRLRDVRIRVAPPSLARPKQSQPRTLSRKAAEHLRHAERIFDDPEIQASIQRLARRADRGE